MILKIKTERIQYLKQITIPVNNKTEKYTVVFLKINSDNYEHLIVYINMLGDSKQKKRKIKFRILILKACLTH